MKTALELQKEVDDILSLDAYKLAKREANKYRKRVEFLNMCIRYLDSKPNESWINDQLNLIEQSITKKMGSFDFWSPPKDVDPKNVKVIYERETGVTLQKKQIKTLKFILHG